MAKCIAVYNEKGGVGKTTTAVMLADGLAHYCKHRVLVIDLDRQASASRMILGSEGIDEAVLNRATWLHVISKYLHGIADIKDCVCKNCSDLIEIRDTKQNNCIDVIPSVGIMYREIADCEKTLAEANPEVEFDIIIEQYLSRSLKLMGRNYDVVIIDCPAGITPYASAAARIADHIVAPTVLEENSLSVLRDLLDFFANDLRINVRKNVSVLMCQVDERNEQQVVMRNHMRRGTYEYPAISRAIPLSPLIQAAMQHPGVAAYRTMKEKYGSEVKTVRELAKAVNTRVYGDRE